MSDGIIFNNALPKHSKLVSSHCRGKAPSKGRSIKLLPRPTRPKENMRYYSASQDYMAQMEFCSFGIFFLKSSCQINTQNKSQNCCRSIYVINDSAAWVTGPEPVLWPAPSHRCFLLLPHSEGTHQSLHRTELCWVWLRSMQDHHQCEMSHELKSSSNQSLKSMLQKSPGVNGVTHSLATFWHLRYICWLI